MGTQRKSFDYETRFEDDVVYIRVPHRMPPGHGASGRAEQMPIRYVREVIVDQKVYQQLRTGNARLFVHYCNLGRTQTPLARVRLSMNGVTDGKNAGYSLAWFVLGTMPPGDMMADHINGDGLDNRRCNLRWATHYQNMRNRHGWGKDSTAMGVRFDRRTRKWVASVICSFESKGEAEAAALRLHTLAYGEFSRAVEKKDHGMDPDFPA